MDQFIMLNYINKIILPATKNRPALLILDEFKAHFTSMVTESFEANKIEHHVIPGGYTSALQPLDVSLNKPLKDRYRQYWAKWFADVNSQTMTDGGNRKKPAYEVVMNWMSECHKDIAKQQTMISRSFSTTGLYHRDFGFKNGLSFVSQLNGRLKEILFIITGGA